MPVTSSSVFCIRELSNLNLSINPFKKDLKKKPQFSEFKDRKWLIVCVFSNLRRFERLYIFFEYFVLRLVSSSFLNYVRESSRSILLS